MSNKVIRRILIIILIILCIMLSSFACLLYLKSGYTLKINDNNRNEVEKILKTTSFKYESIVDVDKISFEWGMPDPDIIIYYKSGRKIKKEPKGNEYNLVYYIKENGTSDKELGKCLFNISKIIIIGIVIFEIIMYFYNLIADIKSVKCNKQVNEDKNTKLF